MKDGATTVEILLNNAECFGGVIGTEYAVLEGKPDLEADFFQDRKILDYHDITFKDIEKTKLGRAIVRQVEKLESYVKVLQGRYTDLQANIKSREASIWKKAEAVITEKFLSRDRHLREAFNAEMMTISASYSQLYQINRDQKGVIKKLT